MEFGAHQALWSENSTGFQAALGASMLGCVLGEQQQARPKKPPTGPRPSDGKLNWQTPDGRPFFATAR